LAHTHIAAAVFVSLFLCTAVGAEVGGGWLATFAISYFIVSEATGAL